MKRTIRQNLLMAGLALVLWAVGSSARAHKLSFTRVSVTFFNDGTFEADVYAHLDAMMLGLPPGEVIAEDYEYLDKRSEEELEKKVESLRTFLKRMTRLRFDGEVFDAALEFTERALPRAEKAEDEQLLGGFARLRGEIPAGAEAFTFTGSRTLGLCVLDIGFEDDEVRIETPLGPGYTSEPFSLIRTEPALPPSGWRVGGRYAALGFGHILPYGLDHILFVVGLFLLAAGAKPLLWQVSAFTAAHTLTLGLATLGVFSLPGRIVEPLIALSIAYVAVENIFTTELKPWRPAVVFGFGLLHGLGFAGALGELGLPKDRFLTALLSFNFGVELGQLAVIGLCFGAVGFYRKRVWYRRRVVIPASGLIALVGLYWTVVRAFGW